MPPVYLPQQSKTGLQLKPDGRFRTESRPAPAVYRPQAGAASSPIRQNTGLIPGATRLDAHRESGRISRPAPQPAVQFKTTGTRMGGARTIQRADGGAPAPPPPPPFCSICQANILAGGAITPCNHDFHAACLNQWMADSQNLANNYHCPNCNATHAATVAPSAANVNHHPPAAAFVAPAPGPGPALIPAPVMGVAAANAAIGNMAVFNAIGNDEL